MLPLFFLSLLSYILGFLQLETSFLKTFENLWLKARTFRLSWIIKRLYLSSESPTFRLSAFKSSLPSRFLSTSSFSTKFLFSTFLNFSSAWRRSWRGWPARSGYIYKTQIYILIYLETDIFLDISRHRYIYLNISGNRYISGYI